MDNEKNVDLKQDTKKVVAPAEKATSIPANDLLDSFDLFEPVAPVEEADAEEVSGSANAQVVFPGVKLHRRPFVYKGVTRYEYVVVVGVPGTAMRLEASFVTSDKKSVETYNKLDVMWSMLPAGQDWMLLGFVYNDFLKSYNYCVQLEYEGIPMRCSLRPKNAASNDALVSIIAMLKKNGKLS